MQGCCAFSGARSSSGNPARQHGLELRRDRIDPREPALMCPLQHFSAEPVSRIFTSWNQLEAWLRRVECDERA
jgi:hypothetical protein